MIRMFNDFFFFSYGILLSLVSSPAFCDESFIASDKAFYFLPESVE
jgi:hypothetical protein